MARWFTLLVGLTAVGLSAPASIPEPDLILFGRVFVDRSVQEQADQVQVIARVDRAPFGNFPGTEDVPVGVARLGALEKQRGACQGADCYVLRVRLESLVDGGTASVGAAALGENIRICTKRGSDPESCEADNSVTATSRGTILYRDLGQRPALCDWNGDGDVNLFDHPDFTSCGLGPGTPAEAQCSAVFDVSGNSRIDLHDFQTFQNLFSSN